MRMMIPAAVLWLGALALTIVAASNGDAINAATGTVVASTATLIFGAGLADRKAGR